MGSTTNRTYRRGNPHRFVRLLPLVLFSLLLFRSPLCVRGELLPPQRLVGGASNDVAFNIESGGEAVLLSLLCRADSGDSGFHHDLQIRVNGAMVNSYLDRQTPRLLNKASLRFDYPRYGSYAWCNTDEGWAAIRAASFDQPVQAAFGEDPFRYVIDITDMVRPGANVVRFTSGRGNKPPFDLVLDDIAILRRGTPVGSKAWETAGDDAVTEGALWSVQQTAAGNLLFTHGRTALRLTSSFTNPGGVMTVTAADDDIKSDGTARTLWRNDALTIERTIRMDGPWLVIEDIMTAHEPLVGNIIRLTLRPEDAPFPHARVCGFPYPEVVQSDEHGNPSVYGSIAGRGMALVVESDVVRQQAMYRYLPDGSMAIEDSRLVIPSGSPFTVRWLVHLGAADDYFAVMADLRQRWKTPRVESLSYAAFVYPETFDHMSDEQLGRYFRESGIGVVVNGTGLTVPNRPDIRWIAGVGLERAEVAERREGLRILRERIRRVAPQVKFLIKVHCYLNSPLYPDDFERFADCLMRGVDGQPVAHPTYGQVFIPSLENEFGKLWRQVIDEAAVEIGADGFYWDESTSPGLPGEVAGWTYHTWDGVSADLDADGRVLRKVANISILTDAYRLAVTREQLAKGRMWCLGGEPRSASFQSLAVNWWRECQHHAYYGFAGPFSQGQAYTSPSQSVAQLRDLLACGAVSCRLAPGQSSPYHRALFPLTVTQIGDGWIRGTDKLITMRTGTYVWPNVNQNLRVLTLSDGNNPVESAATTSAGGELTIEVPEQGLVIVTAVESGK